MRILFTGATGVIGRWTVPRLLANGHEVRAVARDDAGRRRLTCLGAQPIGVDMFDPIDLASAVRGVDAVVNMATAIPPQDRMAKRKSWALNDRLRSEATGLLVDVALAGGTARLVQQSVSLIYADGDGYWINEQSPVRPGWEVLDSALDAEYHVRRFTESGGDGVTLRFSSLYGPGRVSHDYRASVRSGKMPIVGTGDNFVSHLHIADAASSIEAALTAPAGTYNVSDDRPVSRREDLELLSTALNARRPRHVPPWLARAAAGRASHLLTVSHRISAASFTDATGWRPSVPSSAQGWSDVIDAEHHESEEM